MFDILIVIIGFCSIAIGVVSIFAIRTVSQAFEEVETKCHDLSRELMDYKVKVSRDLEDVYSRLAEFGTAGEKLCDYISKVNDRTNTLAKYVDDCQESTRMKLVKVDAELSQLSEKISKLENVEGDDLK